jgi:hypothetical protein
MAALTYYVVLPFFRTTDRDLVPDEPIEVSDSSRARRQAEQVGRARKVAQWRSPAPGDPTTRRYQGAVILARFGRDHAKWRHVETAQRSP